MYHMGKDPAKLITMSSEIHSLTVLSQRVSHFQTRKVNSSKLGGLTMFYIFAGHREHHQNTQVIFMGCS